MSSRASRPRPRSRSSRTRRQRLAAGAVLATTGLLGTYLAAIRPHPTYASPNSGGSEQGQGLLGSANVSATALTLPTCSDAAAQDVVSDDTELRAAILRSDDDSVICIDGTIDLLSPLPSIDDTTLTLVGGDPLSDGINASYIYIAQYDYEYEQILPVDFTGGQDDTLTISGLFLNDGYADDTAGGGGAISLNADDTGDHLVIDNSIFGVNSASDGGGAIRVDGGRLTVAQSRFNGNDSYDYGGAIFLDSGIAEISDTSFEGNYASFGGGAVFASDTALTATRISARQNTSYYGGGAVHLDSVAGSTSAVFTNSYLGSNYAEDGADTGFAAGAVYADDTVQLTLAFTTLYDDSTGYAAAPASIYLGVGSSLTSIGSVVGSSGTSDLIGGPSAGVIDDTYSVATSAVFTGPGSQSAPVGSLQLGPVTGAGPGQSGRAPADTSVLVTGAPISSLGTGIGTDQLGVRRGPAIWTIGARQVNPPLPAGCDALATDDTVLRASITNSQDGDVICIDGTITLQSALPSIDDTTLTITGDDSTLDIIDGNDSFEILTVGFSDPTQDDTLSLANLALIGGDRNPGAGAVYFVGDNGSRSVLELSSVNVEDNIGYVLGGAITAVDADVTIENSQFSENIVDGGGGNFPRGGALFAYRSTVDVRDSSFGLNFTANLGASAIYGSGGAIHVDSGDLHLTRSLVGANFAEEGAGIAVIDGTATIEASNVLVNLSADAGGGIYARDSNVTIQDSRFTGNEADQAGGAILFDDSDTPANTLSIDATSFIANESDAGGAIALIGGASLQASASSFLLNEARLSSGGAIASPTGDVSLVNSYLGRNIAANGAASVLSVAGDVDLTFTTIYDDSVATAGLPRSVAIVGSGRLTAIGSVIGSPTDDTVLQIDPVNLDDSYSISTGQGQGFGGVGSAQVPGGSLDLADLDGSEVGSEGRSPYPGSILLTGAPGSDLGTGVTTDQLGVTRGPRWTIGSRQDAAVPPPPPPSPVAPSAPTAVVAVGGDGQATIAWTAPSAAGSFPVTTYQAVATPGGRSCIASAPAATCTITGLTNGVTYTATVRALNGAGWGPFSSASNAFTPAAEETPPGPVRDLRGSAAPKAPGVLRVRWRPPVDAGSSPITGYRVAYRRIGTEDFIRVRPNPTATRIRISGLEPGRYVVRVAARNDSGYGRGTRTTRIVIPR